ncbi:MAG: tetratricopeptide repeat protein, partial [Elainellaceae cyanobacterium]
LVDFYATWCGPCQMLKPMLEKLVKEYDFVLAKVDIDQNPDLANAYRVEGVPDVRIVHQGEMKPGFVGVLQEPQIRSLLAGLGLKSALEEGMDRLQQAIAQGNVEAANAQFSTLMEHYPQNQQLQLDAAKFRLGQNDFDGAEQRLQGLADAGDRLYAPQARTLLGMVQLQRVVQQVKPETEVDQVFLKAAQSALAQDFETAMQLFLEVVSRDRAYRDDAARKSLLTLFGILGDNHPLTRHYRKLLMATLY